MVAQTHTPQMSADKVTDGAADGQPSLARSACLSHQSRSMSISSWQFSTKTLAERAL